MHVAHAHIVLNVLNHADTGAILKFNTRHTGQSIPRRRSLECRPERSGAGRRNGPVLRHGTSHVRGCAGLPAGGAEIFPVPLREGVCAL